MTQLQVTNFSFMKCVRFPFPDIPDCGRFSSNLQPLPNLFNDNNNNDNIIIIIMMMMMLMIVMNKNI